MVLFHPLNKSDRILAANSGWYTLPDDQIALPYGIRETVVDVSSLVSSFQKQLTLLLGQLDNATETRGALQKSARAMEQGDGRFSRGHYFYDESKVIANKMDVEFNWNVVDISEVGHDFRKMSGAAAVYLYEAVSE